MTIGIDIRVLANNIKSGVEEYTENLLAHLLPLDKDIKFKLFFASFRGELPNYDWLSLKNVELFKFKIPNKILFLSSGLLDQPKADKLMDGVDVFFSPHFFLTSLSKSCKRVTTFHDLSYVHYPEFFSWRKNIWHNLEMNPKWQSRFSDKIIAVSDSTAKDLANIYEVDPTKVEVIYSGISPDIKRPTPEKLVEFKMRNKLPDQFILSLGKLEPRKNIVSIIKAFNIIKNKNLFNDLHLVIAGSRGWLYKDIFREIDHSPYKNKIIIKDHVSDEERSFYFSLAEVFIYPSFFEGFGFPPIEAMKCGTPVIVSGNSSLPETVEKAGLLIKPNNLGDLTRAIELVLDNKSLRTALIKDGIKRSELFNWHNTAEKTLSCLLK